MQENSEAIFPSGVLRCQKDSEAPFLDLLESVTVLQSSRIGINSNPSLP